MGYEPHLSDFFVIGAGLVLILLLFNAQDLFDDGRKLWRRHVMSRLHEGSHSEMAGELVHVPVSPTSTQAGTEGSAGAEGGGVSPDTNAVPRISRYLSDSELIVLLACQRLPGGKYRLSANDIARLMGGKRADVLALVRAVREGPAQYPARTPEQEALRRELKLDQP